MLPGSFVTLPLASCPLATLDMLASTFSIAAISAARAARFGLVDPDAYHPALRPLYTHFLATLYSICAPFTRDPHELAYIAAARWPGFVQPVLDEHRRHVLAAHGISADRDVPDNEDGMADAHDEMQDDEVDDADMLAPPTEDMRIRLTRLFTPSFTAALEALYPRLENATEWVSAHAPPAGLLALPPMQATAAMHTTADAHIHAGVEALPRLSKFILVAAFLASTNPPKSDMRMFGRGPDERAKRRRRKGGSPRKVKAGAKSGSVKVCDDCRP